MNEKTYTTIKYMKNFKDVVGSIATQRKTYLIFSFHRFGNEAKVQR